MPHANIELPADLHKRARALALEKGTSLKQVMIEALEIYVAKGEAETRRDRKGR